MSAVWSVGTAGAKGAGLAEATPAGSVWCCRTDIQQVCLEPPCSLCTQVSMKGGQDGKSQGVPLLHQGESLSMWAFHKGITYQGHVRGPSDPLGRS